MLLLLAPWSLADQQKKAGVLASNQGTKYFIFFWPHAPKVRVRGVFSRQGRTTETLNVSFRAGARAHKPPYTTRRKYSQLPQRNPKMEVSREIWLVAVGISKRPKCFGGRLACYPRSDWPETRYAFQVV